MRVIETIDCPVNSPVDFTDESAAPEFLPQRALDMELTAESFRQIVEAHKSEPTVRRENSSTAPREQRKTPRTKLTVQAALMPFSDKFALETIVSPVRD